MSNLAKVSLAAVAIVALALVPLLGVTIGTAAAPDPLLSDDLVFVGNGGPGGNNVKVLDIDAMAVVNTIGGGGLLANNHGVLVEDGVLWNANAALAGYDSRIVKLDLGTMEQTAYDVASADQYGFTVGLCGIEFAPDGKIWATSMSSAAGNGGIYEFDKETGATGGYVNTGVGEENRATCGIGWSADGTTAYASLMGAKKLTTMAWPGGAISDQLDIIDTGALHILDVARTANYAYVTGGNIEGTGKLAIVDLSSNTQVGTLTGPPGSGDWHGPTVAHDEGILYIHSRGGSAGTNPDFPGTLYIYDIGGVDGGTGTKTEPALLGYIADEGTGGISCGSDVAAKSDYCGEPVLEATRENTYYASSDDWAARIISVDFVIDNTSGGSLNAYAVEITGADNSDGVTLGSGTPVEIGDIPAGGSDTVTLKFEVPGGVESFTTDLAFSADDLCAETNTPTSGVIALEVPEDTTPPVTTADPSEGWFNEAFDVTLSATDEASGVEVTKYRINYEGDCPDWECDIQVPDQQDEDLWTVYEGPIAIDEEGEYMIEFFSVDNAGNAEEVSTVLVGLDATPPVTTADPSEGWFNEAFDVTLSATDEASGVEVTKYRINYEGDCPDWECDIQVPDQQDEDLWTVYEGPIAIDEEGEYMIEFFSVDNAGNAEEVSTVLVGLDTVAPVITDMAPAGAITDISPVISASYSDTGSGIDADSVTVTLDGEELEGCEATDTGVTCQTEDLAEGEHTARVALSDNAGNEAWEEWTFSISAEILSRNYHWTWYDDLYGDNWVLVANPVGAETGLC
ncbi:MAG: hypothetical protein IBX61_09215, partial [Thermoleophilia bacterium]|nr:hypothetical protein [Thermoleophilia bacterium]